MLNSDSFRILSKLSLIILWNKYNYSVSFVSASISATVSAAAAGWITPTLPKLLHQEGNLSITVEDASWVVTMPQFGKLLSPIPAGVLADTFGRKTVLLASGPVFLLGWLILLYFQNVLAFYVGRIVHGIAMSIVSTILPMYLAEIAAPRYRGLIVSISFNCGYLGYIFAYVTGSIFSFTSFTYAIACLNLLFLVVFVWQPESPYYCMMKNDVFRARQALFWLSSTSEDKLDAELERIKQSVEQDKAISIKWRDLLHNPTNRKCLIILLFISSISQLSGLSLLSSFSTQTLTFQGDYFFLSPKTVTITMGLMMFLGSLGSNYTLDLFGRRTVYLVSCVLSGLCMFFIATFYLLKQYSNFNLSFLSWVPATGLIISSATFVLGIYPVNALYQSELFGTRTRASVSSINTVYDTILGIIAFKYYLPIEEVFGDFVNFYIFNIMCFIGAISSFTIMPETKGMSFHQIKYEMQTQ